MNVRHPNPRRAWLAGALATLALLGAQLPQQAHAADWKPDKPVTLVVPYSPGGGTDALSRAVAREMQKIWGQTVIVENVAGADGLIGTRKVADSKPDGTMLLVQLPSLTLLKHLPTFKGVDPVTTVTPVSMFASLAGVVVANAALPVKTLPELVTYCRTAAKPCSLGTTENIARLQARMLGMEANLPNLIVANYKGGGQLITDIVANNVNTGIMGITAVLPHYKSGSLKVLATLGTRRSAVAPEVPSAVEAGFPYFDAVTWYGVFAPKDTPPHIVQAIAAVVQQAVQGEDAKKTFALLGAEGVGNTPAEFARIVKEEGERFGTLAKRFPIE